MLSCAEAVRRLWEHLEDDLDAHDHERVDAHLALCRRCCGEAEFIAELGTMLATASSPPLPDDVSRNLLGFLEQLDGGPA